MKKALSLIMAVIMVFSMNSYAFAAETETDHTEEYFRFKDSTERMSSTGEFEFYCNSYLTSDHFVANSDQITVEASAKIYNRNTGSTTTSFFKKFTITVHKVGGGDLSPVLTVRLNGKTASVTVDVEEGEEYYLIIESSSDLDAVLYMDGEGSVSPVTKVS